MLDKDTCKSLVVFFSFCKTFHQKYSVFSAVLCFIFTQLLTFTPGSYNYISLLLDTAAPLGLDTVVFLAVGRASEIKRSFCLLDPPTFSQFVLEVFTLTLCYHSSFLTFVPRYCSFTIGCESLDSSLCPLEVALPGLILFIHNAILSSAALESHGVTCNRMLNVAEREHTGHLGTLNNKCKGRRSIILLAAFCGSPNTHLVTEMLQAEQRTRF